VRQDEHPDAIVGAIPGGGIAQHAVSAQVFVDLIPVDGLAPANNLPVVTLLWCCPQQAVAHASGMVMERPSFRRTVSSSLLTTTSVTFSSAALGKEFMPRLQQLLLTLLNVKKAFAEVLQVRLVLDAEDRRAARLVHHRSRDRIMYKVSSGEPLTRAAIPLTRLSCRELSRSPVHFSGKLSCYKIPLGGV
jgi:hypothetical protein